MADLGADPTRVEASSAALDDRRLLGNSTLQASTVASTASDLGGTQAGAVGAASGGMAATANSSVGSFASFQNARETRTMETIKMKDEQLRILADQNSQLLKSLDTVEEEANGVQLEKLAVEEENRTVRDQNFELQSKARAAESQLKKAQAEMSDKDKQLKIMTDQNSELLRLLETEEAQTSKLELENQKVRQEADTLKGKYGSLLTTAKTHEEMAARAAREGQLRAEEVRLLRAETEQLRTANAEMKMKTQVELESLHEQLRVRKEKQYQLLEKLQASDEAKRQAEDQVATMEEKLRGLHAKNVELETQLQVETRAKRSQQDANKKLLVEQEHLSANVKELQGKVDRSESERLRMEAEARDSSEQLREMAEKVFQLLERLKLAELGKTKAVEALRRKEQEMLALKKKNSRLLKEGTKEGKARVKAELDKKVLIDQIRALKKHNTSLSSRCREEVKGKLKEMDEKRASAEKVKVLGGRLSFLLNKMQSDEEAKVVAREEMQKITAQLATMKERNEELSGKLQATGESNRIITQAMRFKQEELDELMIKHEALQKAMARGAGPGGDSDDDGAIGGGPEVSDGCTGTTNGVVGAGNDGGPTDGPAVRGAGGKGLFFVESKPSQGVLVLKAKKQATKEFLAKYNLNQFLKKAQKSPNFKPLVIERLANILGLLMVETDEAKALSNTIEDNREQLEHLTRKTLYLQEKIGAEEDTKRRTLLRYIHAVKAAAAPVDGEVGPDGRPLVHEATKGVLQLPESGIGDEEVHAIAALLRGNGTILELNLRGNVISDEGARALAACLSGRSALRQVDLRGNSIGKGGIRAIAEALERSERVRHVYIHAQGKIEALGTGMWAAPRAGDEGTTTGEVEVDGGAMVTVETVCVVDVRDNTNSTDADFSDTHGKAVVRPSVADGADVGGSAVSAQVSQAKALGKTLKRSKKQLNAEAAKHKEARRRRHGRKEKDAERKRNVQREGKWRGRAGGLDTGSIEDAGFPAINGASGTSGMSQQEEPPHSAATGTRRTGSAPGMGPHVRPTRTETAANAVLGAAPSAGDSHSRRLQQNPLSSSAAPPTLVRSK